MGSGYGCGTVFKLKPSGSSYTESILYRFQGTPDAEQPDGNLVIDESTGTLYGVTANGGEENAGALFSLTPNKRKSYTERVLFNWLRQSFDIKPYGNITLGAHGTIFGASENSWCGLLFELSPLNGVYYKTPLHFFLGPNKGDGCDPTTVTLVGSTIYGATLSGGTSGSSGDGTVYSYNRVVPASSAYHVLHSFSGGDGIYAGGLAVDSGGAIYGVTAYGGTGSPSGGTVFKLSPSKSR